MVGTVDGCARRFGQLVLQIQDEKIASFESYIRRLIAVRVKVAVASCAIDGVVVNRQIDSQLSVPAA
jgi:hypothetical protein